VTNQKVLGVLFGISAGAMWAAEAILGKLLFRSFDFIQVAALEAFFGTLTAFAYVFLRRERVNLDRKDTWNLLVVGLVGTVFASLMYFRGLTETYAVNATLIGHMQPLFVAFFGFYFLKEGLHKHDLVAVMLMISAAILITTRTPAGLVGFRFGNRGDLMVLFATVSWAFVAIPGKRLTEKASSVVIVGCRFLIASLAFMPVLLGLNRLIVSSIEQVLLGVLVGLGYVFYYEGLRRIKAGQIALTELSAPFFTAVFAWYLLNEIVTPMQIVGALLLASGLYVLTLEKPLVGEDLEARRGN